MGERYNRKQHTKFFIFLNDKEGVKIKKSNRNFIRPLIFQFKTWNAYKYCKSKAKFIIFFVRKIT
nr:plasmid partition family protein [Borreliella bissettiae]